MSERKKTALVTGASSGIGRETSKRLAAAGYEVIAAARRKDRLDELAGGRAGIVARPVDLADPVQVEGFCAELSGRSEPIDVLVNCAGYSLRGVVEAVPVEAIRRMFEVNVFALVRVTQACLPGMRAARGGIIVNFSSIVGKYAFPGSGPYAATKHAIEALTDALRHEAAPFGIRVVAVRPGPIATEFNEAAGDYSRSAAENTPEDYQPVTGAVGAGFGRMFGGLTIPGPEVVAEVVMKAIGSENPRAAYEMGPLADTHLPQRKHLDDDEWKAFMDQQLGLTGLKV